MTVPFHMVSHLISMMLAAALTGAAVPVPDLVVPPGSEPELIRLVPGQRLDLRLAVSFSMGMSWVVAGIEGDAVSFEGSKGLYGPDAGGDLPEGVEVQSLIFLARKEGKATIELHFKRPWEAQAPPRKVLRIMVSVEASADGGP